MEVGEKNRIIRAVKRVRELTDATDPFRICEQLGIIVALEDFGTDPGAIRGFSTIISRIRCVAINSAMPEEIQRAVLGHEIGHLIMHCEGEVRMYHDKGTYNGGTKAEEEANFFAAELLICDEDVLDVFEYGYPFHDAAIALCVPAELLDYKIRLMQEKGKISVNEIPVHASPKFFKNV